MKILCFFIAVALCGFLATSCQKEKTAINLTSGQVAQVQNTDVQDAIADKNDQDIDNILDQLQVVNYQPSNLKSALITGSRTITVSKSDSTTFPKTIVIVYSNYPEGTADEKFIKNGEIDITVTIPAGNISIDLQAVTRVQTFKNYSITTDSTTVTINGTRTVARTAHLFKFTGLTSLRLTTTDNITANLKYAITKTGVSDTLKFTRVISAASPKIRKAYLHYVNSTGTNWQTVKFVNNPALDTITYSGTVTGTIENGDIYSKTVSASTPLTVTFYNGTPVISSGTLNFVVTSSITVSFTITYKEDPAHPHLTLVTVTNDATGATHSFDRRISRKFVKWW